MRKVALFLFARDLFVHEVERNDPHQGEIAGLRRLEDLVDVDRGTTIELTVVSDAGYQSALKGFPLRFISGHNLRGAGRTANDRPHQDLAARFWLLNEARANEPARVG